MFVKNYENTNNLFFLSSQKYREIASVFAKTLDAEVKTPTEVDPNVLSDYDLIGFGSGINFGKHHKVLLDFADKLPQVTGKKGFIFSTSGQTGDASKFHKKLREKLESKGFGIVGSLTVQDVTPMPF